MKKKLFTGILASTMLLSMATSSFATETTQSPEALERISTKTLSTGQCGEDAQWNFDQATGAFTVTGTGDMYNYDFGDNSAPWYSILSEIKSLHIAQGITSIGDRNFVGLTMSDISLPSTLTSIGNYAFYNCAFTTISIPDSVTTIGAGAFYSCWSLESIYIPETTVNIGKEILWGSEMNFGFVWAMEQVTVYGHESSKAQVYCKSQGTSTFGPNTYSNNHQFEVVTQRPDWAVISDGSVAPTSPTSPKFDSWAESFVEFALENNLIVDSLGMDYTKSITRNQIADLLVNMIEQYTGKTLDVSSESFTDTDNTQILKAYEAGIISGRGNGIFDPEATATRQEMAIMVINSIKTMEEITGNSLIDHSLTTIDGYSDMESAWAKEALSVLANAGIMSGAGDKINPNGNTTIQESLVMNNNLFQLEE